MYSLRPVINVALTLDTYIKEDLLLVCEIILYFDFF